MTTSTPIIIMKSALPHQVKVDECGRSEDQQEGRQPLLPFNLLKFEVGMDMGKENSEG